MKENVYMEPFKTASLRVGDYLPCHGSCNLSSISDSSVCQYVTYNVSTPDIQHAERFFRRNDKIISEGDLVLKIMTL